jgi:putative addiction module antidote
MFFEENAMTTLKLTQIDNSLGVILPKEFLAKLKLQKGDELFVTENPLGISLSGYNPNFEEQLELRREFMREYSDTFKALAE